jgi:hypothetical protein
MIIKKARRLGYWMITLSYESITTRLLNNYTKIGECLRLVY